MRVIVQKDGISAKDKGGRRRNKKVKNILKITLKGKISTGEVWMNGKLLTPERSLKIRNHSPSGFNWGYGGSGPSQLALAILLEIMPSQPAISAHQQFKWDVIATLPQTDFEKEIELPLQLIKKKTTK